MSRWRIGVNSQVWVAGFAQADLDLVRHAAQLGFDAIEVSYATLTPPFDPTALRRALADAHLSCTFCGFLSADRDVSSADAAARRRGLEYFESALTTAAEVGARLLCGPLYAELFRARHLPDAERHAEWDRSVEAFHRVAELAAQTGVKVALEPLNRFETDFLNTAEAALRFVHAVGSPHVGIHLDTFHMNIEERDPAGAIQTAGPHLLHFHACENDRGAPGSGHVPWEAVCDALQSVAYPGLVVIEGFNRQVVDLANGARMWRDLAQSPDDLAQSGRAFLARILA